jgi:hypothetical protein
MEATEKASRDQMVAGWLRLGGVLGNAIVASVPLLRRRSNQIDAPSMIRVEGPAAQTP